MGTQQTTRDEVLDPHLPSGEELKASAVGQGRITAVTDRRVLSVSETGGGTEQQREVESILLTSDRVVGTRYGRTDSENKATLQRLFGIGLVLLAGLLLYGATEASGDAQGAMAFFALLVFGLGAYLYQAAEDTKAGSVSITVRRAGDIPNRTWTFPRGRTEVPRAISEQVAIIHGPDRRRRATPRQGD